MGRRHARLDEPHHWVFNRLAADYRERPGYPAALADRLLELAGGPGAAIADLGAGTGLLALPLAKRGARVFAVEPAASMLAALRASAAGLPVEPVQAAAESTGLAPASVQQVLLADALQWVEPERAGREAARILAPGGVVAVLSARLADTPFAGGLARLIERTNPKARPRPPGRLGQLLRAAGAEAWAQEEWRHEEVLSPERLDAVLRSLSLVGPALGPGVLRSLLSEARDLARRLGGAAFTRDLTLSWGRRR
ncbi:MAG TPA: methyltransferase domain-containing protein [Anaeromyxobacteraceae bacterium]|nr:methyltransferase domain-containing protein [Anaeromyxobacteraceae bacterium]